MVSRGKPVPHDGLKRGYGRWRGLKEIDCRSRLGQVVFDGFVDIAARPIPKGDRLSVTDGRFRGPGREAGRSSPNWR